MSRRNWIAACLSVLCAALLTAVHLIPAFAAATYDSIAQDNNNVLVTVTTSATVTVTLAQADYTLVHLGIQNDGTTPSVSTDILVMMNQQTAAAAAVSMAANYTDGNKLIVNAGAAATFPASLIPAGSDGPHEIQLKCVGHGCKACLIRGH